MNLLGAIGQARPVSDFINTAGQYQQMQSSLETQRLQQQRLQAEAAQAEKDNREYHVDGALSLYPETHRPIILKALQMDGRVTPEGIVRGKDMRGVPDLLKKTGLHINVYQAEYDALKAESEKLGKKSDSESQQKVLANATEMANLKRLIDKELGVTAEEKGFTLGEGQKRFDASGKEIAAVAKPPEPTKTRTIKEGDTEYTEEWVDGAWKRIAEAPRYKPTTNVVTNVDMGLSRGARAKAEEDVQESTDMYKGLETLVAISKPDFFTYKGQIQAGAERLGEKAGVVKDPKFLKEYSSWKVGTEQEFNKYRKWATGVAAGEKELERLAGSFPNVNMSKTQYMSAAKQTAVNAWKLAERRRRALNAGINDPGKQKDFYRLLPLDSMPDPPPEIVERFSPKSKFEILGVE